MREAFAGRVSPEKGLGVFLAAASSVPHVTFKVAGDGPLLAEMKAIAPTNVKFLGKLEFEDLKALYRNSRLLAVPSLGYELFGMVVVDAMALGVPVIASRIGGLPYVVEDGVTGLLFEPGNAAELAEQVRRLWEDPALCARLGKAGQQRVQEHYTQKCYYENLMRVYGTAIQRRQTSRAISPQS